MLTNAEMAVNCFVLNGNNNVWFKSFYKNADTPVFLYFYASAHATDEAGSIMFSGCLVSLCVHPGRGSDRLAIEFYSETELIIVDVHSAWYDSVFSMWLCIINDKTYVCIEHLCSHRPYSLDCHL